LGGGQLRLSSRFDPFAATVTVGNVRHTVRSVETAPASCVIDRCRVERHRSMQRALVRPWPSTRRRAPGRQL